MTFARPPSFAYTAPMKFPEKLLLTQELMGVGLIGVVFLVAALTWYGYNRVSTLSRQVLTLSGELASTTALLQVSLTDASTTLQATLAAERARLERELGGVRDQVGSIKGSVSTLEKLTTTDPELLAKYSKVFFLSEHYAPARLVPIPEEYRYDEKKTLQVIPQVLPHLEDLLDAAADDGIELYIDSAYRSFDTQEALKNRYVVTYGAGTANQFSAEQGYSEHQLGTTVDFITVGTGGGLEGFDRTKAYAWLQENAYKYGFVLSYPPNNGYYVFEPWHWRFVGEELASDLHKKNTYFYSLDQRTIDTYLPTLFD
jgi:zinc D-Ala-D-Ala carboxypeptidase